MSWQERLNLITETLALDGAAGGTLQLLGWNYQAHLSDNLPHRHTFYEVCQVGAYGEGQFHTAGIAFPIGPGDLFIARPRIVHQIVNTGQPLMELRWVSFYWHSPPDGVTGEVTRLFKALAQSDIWVATDPQDRLGSLWRTLLSFADGPIQQGSRRQFEGLIEALVIAIAQAGSGDLLAPVPAPKQVYDADEKLVQTAISYIDDNLDRALSVPEIGGHLCCSTRQCTRLFTEYLGTSPAAFVAERRLTLAARMLRYSSLPIKEIAAAVGVPDIAHFTRRFSGRFGCPPGAFRREDNRSVPSDTLFVPNRQVFD